MFNEGLLVCVHVFFLNYDVICEVGKLHSVLFS